jgi:tRNA splicing endonuclease
MGLFLVDGHKFGGEFLAYEYNPDYNHATYLVFVKGKDIVN